MIPPLIASIGPKRSRVRSGAAESTIRRQIPRRTGAGGTCAAHRYTGVVDLAFRGRPSQAELNSLYELAEALDVNTDCLLGRTGDRVAHLDRKHFLRLGGMDKNEPEIMLEIAKVLSKQVRK